jgi:hypothetical protein
MTGNHPHDHNMLTRLMYISLSTLPLMGAQSGLAAITEVSAARNPALSITGALLYTGTHFSQVLEGSNDSIETLMSAIRADPRHDSVLIIEHLPVNERLFDNWSLAYTGRASYVQKVLERCLQAPDERHGPRSLLRLFREFARD